MRKIFPVFLLFQVALFGAIDFSVMDCFQEKWTRGEIEERLGLFLQKDGHVGSFFSIDQEGLTLYNLPETQKDREIEYRLKFARERHAHRQQEKKKNLVGVKIALDPGHFGGVFARLEERYIDIPPSLERSDQIRFDEGTLSFLTASYLKVLLEKEGANVMITRDQIGKGVYPENFFEWLSKNPKLWSGEISLRKLFRKQYNPLDLRARAEKINAFAPDLTIVIHYNSHDVEESSSSNNSVAANNYNLVFVPGAFCRGELAEYENRFEFLRLLASDDLHQSLCLSRAILRQFSKHLEVPVVAKEDGLRYLDRVCLQLEEGVFARNLALTRLIHGPVCYGETLIQNNIDECRNLSRTDFVIDGKKCSSRVKQVAEAYFDGIIEFLFAEQPKE